jgi:uncharacterized membrane protein
MENFKLSFELVGENGLRIERRGSCPQGELSIVYLFRKGAPLKIAVEFLAFEDLTMRFTWRIGGTKAMGHRSARVSHLRPAAVDQDVGTVFFDNFGRVRACFLWREEAERENAVIETSLSRENVKVSFGNFTLRAGQSAVLDPYISEPALDGRILKYGAVWPPSDQIVVNTSFTHTEVGTDFVSGGTGAGYYIFRAYLSFNTKNIPDKATVTSAKLYIYVSSEDVSNYHYNVEVYAGGYGSSLDQGDWDCGTSYQGIIYSSSSDSPGKHSLSISTSAVNKTGRTQFELRSDKEDSKPSGLNSVSINTGDAGSNQPRLEVTYKQPPTSSVNPIDPYWQVSSSFTVTASASDPDGDAIVEVSLYYRHSTDNSNWEENWTLFGVDASPPWEWTFTSPRGDGYYEFYTIAKDNAENESAPGTADARCVVIDVERHFPLLWLSRDELYQPCSFYFDNDNNIDNNPQNYDARREEKNLPPLYAYVHTAEDEARFGIQYWFYYAYDWGSNFGILSDLFGRPFEHPQDFEPVVAVFDKTNLSRPSEFGWGLHGCVYYTPYESVIPTEGHPTSFVAEGKHGNYHNPNWIWNLGDRWENRGPKLRPVDFNWILAEGCTGEHRGKYRVVELVLVPGGGPYEYTVISYMVDEPPPPENRHKLMFIFDERFCNINVTLSKGDPHPEPAVGYWPTHFRDDKAPWHKPEAWEPARPAPWPHWYIIHPYSPWGEAMENLPPDYKAQIRISSPADAHVYDSENRHVGVDENRWVEKQIPGVNYYFDNEGRQYIKFENLNGDNYRAEVVGLENGTLSLELTCFGSLGVEYGHWLRDLPIAENERKPICLNQRAIEISPQRLSGSPGETLSYDITIMNLDNLVDNFTLTAEGERGWSLSISPDRFENLTPNENRTATLTVLVPENPPKPALEKIAVLLQGTRLSAFATSIAVAEVRDVAVSISPSAQSGLPGATLTYVVTISNEGTRYENLVLTVSDNEGWGLVLSENTFENIPPYENRRATLSVSVPSNAIHGTKNLITVTATSSENAAVSDNASAEARVEALFVELTPSFQHGRPGQTLKYDVTVTNLHKASYTYNLSASDEHGWALDIRSPLSVPAGENRTAELEVTIPENASFTYNPIRVTATGGGASATGKGVAQCGLVIYPLADAYVIEAFPDNNYGSNPFLRVTTSRWSPENPYNDDNLTWEQMDDLEDPIYHHSFLNERVLLKFSTENIPDGMRVREAKLYLFCQRWYATYNLLYDHFDVYAHPQENTEWLEHEVTWNTQPVFRDLENCNREGDRFFRRTSNYGYEFQYHVSDVTPDVVPQSVVGWTIAYPGYPWELNEYEDQPETGIYTSKENPLYFSPFLRVVYVPAEVPNGDAYVWHRMPSTNYDTENLVIGIEDEGPVRAWLKFDLSNIPLGHEITSARLWLYFHSSEGDEGPGGALEGIQIYSANDAWSENGITWDTQPELASSPTDNIPQFAEAGWKSWDVTPDVQREFQRDKKVSWCLRAGLEEVRGGHDFNIAYSGEYRNPAYRPYLQITHVYNPCYEVSASISPDQAHATLGTEFTFTLTIRNEGNLIDNYALGVSDNAGWPLTLSENLLENVWPYENRTVKLTVFVPENEAPYAEDNVLVTIIGTGTGSLTNCLVQARPRLRVYPSDDALVNDDSPSMNFGDLSWLVVGFDPNGVSRTWLKFDLSSVPNGASVTSAKLWLYFPDSFYGAGGGIAVHRSANDSWLEGTITWSNQPSYDPSPTDTVPRFDDWEVWRNWDVTQDVEQELSDDGKITWCLTAVSESEGGSNQAYSKEYADPAYRPHLEIAYVYVP